MSARSGAAFVAVLVAWSAAALADLTPRQYEELLARPATFESQAAPFESGQCSYETCRALVDVHNGFRAIDDRDIANSMGTKGPRPSERVRERIATEAIRRAMLMHKDRLDTYCTILVALARNYRDRDVGWRVAHLAWRVNPTGRNCAAEVAAAFPYLGSTYGLLEDAEWQCRTFGHLGCDDILPKRPAPDLTAEEYLALLNRPLNEKALGRVSNSAACEASLCPSLSGMHYAMRGIFLTPDGSREYERVLWEHRWEDERRAAKYAHDGVLSRPERLGLICTLLVTIARNAEGADLRWKAIDLSRRVTTRSRDCAGEVVDVLPATAETVMLLATARLMCRGVGGRFCERLARPRAEKQ
ncbi:MAG: hypothetical protein NT133_14280 [Alphaproteobacteria bacterium]|nr:hypothetical protein [Alphaproteobacteria bacterium]